MERRAVDGDPTEPRALVVGATGYAGRHVVAACRARGIATVAHVRPDSRALDEWRTRFGDLGAAVDTSPWTLPAMIALLVAARPTHLFMLLGTTRRRARAAADRGAPAESYATVDYALPHLMIDAACAAAAADPTFRPRLVYLSAVGAREDTRTTYLRVRGRLERELRESGLPWLSVRPAFVTGPDREEPRWLERGFAAVLDALLLPLLLVGAGRVRDRYRAITGAALGEGMVRLALAEAGAGAGAGRAVGVDEVR